MNQILSTHIKAFSSTSPSDSQPYVEFFNDDYEFDRNSPSTEKVIPKIPSITIINIEEFEYLIGIEDPSSDKTKGYTLNITPGEKIDLQNKNTDSTIIKNPVVTKSTCNNGFDLITLGIGIEHTNMTNQEYSDNYTITINNCTDIIKRGASIHFERIFSNKVNSNMLMENKLLKSLQQEPTLIPYININGQTLIDFSDVGNMIFTIGDEFQYYEEKPLKNTNCITPYLSNNIKLTIFDLPCPLMVNVLKGKGKTSIEKAKNVNKNEVLPFDVIYMRIILYGMLKYILARILYGKFNIKYLLNKYDKQLLINLSNSRFCNFTKLFTDPNSVIFGYEKYFM